MPKQHDSSHRFAALAALVITPALLLGCPKAEEKKAPKKAAVKKETPPAKKAPAMASDADCIAPWKTDGEAQKIAAGDRAFDRTGAKLKESSTDDDKKAVIGVLANIKEDTADNLENIQTFLEYFEEKKVDSIVIAGDLGETKSQIENALLPIAAKGLPTFVVIGNREKKSDFNDAVRSVAGKHPNVVNLNHVRLAALDDVSIVSVPGYYDKAYIHAEDGCAYTQADIDATANIVKAAEGAPVIVVSHGPPKQDGTEALDRTLEQANVGDPMLAKMLASTGVKLGIFSNIQEAGGRATDLSGKTVLEAGKPQDSLFLNPGAVDSVSWQMNDGTRSVGMAAVLTVDGGKAMFDVKRIPEG
ncbi:MAG: metallophosphoesterase [Deltaproteobacteria bacterium]|jgi:Icc-related predicted phosphoesterase